MSDIKKFENAIINNRYKIFEYINQGNFGLVFKAFDLLNKKIIAIKIIDKPLTTEQKIITQQEILINLILDHPNICKCFEVCIDDSFSKNIFMIFEYANSGSLQDIFKKYDLTENDIKKIAKDIFKALDYCHSKRICHKDLKPNNILVFIKNDESTYKLTDWGSITSSKFEDEKIQTNIFFSSPEAYTKINNCEFQDIWALGILLYYLFTSNSPFFSKNENEHMNNIKNYKYNDKNDDKIPKVALDFIKKMITLEPEKRLTYNEALNHEWFKI